MSLSGSKVCIGDDEVTEEEEDWLISVEGAATTTTKGVGLGLGTPAAGANFTGGEAVAGAVAVLPSATLSKVRS
jgi:hypothetical protein